jgi:hypothetical protein
MAIFAMKPSQCSKNKSVFQNQYKFSKWHGHRDLYGSGHGQSNCAHRKILWCSPVTARRLGPKGPGISIIWEEIEDFEISTPCAKCFKPQHGIGK